MKFHDTSNPYDSLTHYANELVNLSATDTTEYPLATKARATNTAKYKMALLLWQVNDAWSFDDGGYTDLPIATTTLVAGQRDYTLPTTALVIERIEIKDAAGNYYQIPVIDESNIEPRQALTNYGESNGTPARAWIKGRSLFIDPAPATGAVTMTAGIKIYFKREINEFTPSTTTSEVGFDEPGDRAVAHMVALEFAYRKRPDLVSGLEIELYGGSRNGAQVPGLIGPLLARVGRRTEQMKPKIRIKVEEME